MIYTNIKTLLKNWIVLNKSFLLRNYKNYKSGKRKIIFDFKMIEDMRHSYQPVFFLSTGRCGTKFISKVFESCLLCDVYHHASPDLIFHQQLAFNNPKADIVRYIIESARLELILDSYRRNRIYIETNNRLTFFSYALAELFPNSKFIHLLRHPADFVRSGMRRNWFANKSLDDIGRIIPIENNDKWREFTQFEKIVLLWNETNNFIEQFKSEISENRIITIKSESLFSEFGNFEKLAHFVGISKINSQMRRSFNKPANIQKSGKFENYENWTKKNTQIWQENITII